MTTPSKRGKTTAASTPGSYAPKSNSHPNRISDHTTDVESTAVRMLRSGNGKAVRIVGGCMDGYAATQTPSGEIWTSGGLSGSKARLADRGVTVIEDPERQAEFDREAEAHA